MAFQFPLVTAFLVLFCSASSANLTEQNRAAYPTLAQVIETIKESNQAALQDINWGSVNEALSSPSASHLFNSHGSQLLYDLDGQFNLALIRHFLHNLPALSTLYFHYNGLYNLFVESFQAEPLEQTNISNLVTLLNQYPQLSAVLFVLFRNIPVMARCILENLELLTHNDLTLIQTETSENFQILNSKTELKRLLSHFHSQKFHRLIWVLLRWFLQHQDINVAIPVIAGLVDMIDSNPEQLASLNQLEEPSLMDELSNLVATDVSNHSQTEEDSASEGSTSGGDEYSTESQSANVDEPHLQEVISPPASVGSAASSQGAEENPLSSSIPASLLQPIYQTESTNGIDAVLALASHVDSLSIDGEVSPQIPLLQTDISDGFHQIPHSLLQPVYLTGSSGNLYFDSPLTSSNDNLPPDEESELPPSVFHVGTPPSSQGSPQEEMPVSFQDGYLVVGESQGNADSSAPVGSLPPLHLPVTAHGSTGVAASAGILPVLESPEEGLVLLLSEALTGEFEVCP